MAPRYRAQVVVDAGDLPIWLPGEVGVEGLVRGLGGLASSWPASDLGGGTNRGGGPRVLALPHFRDGVHPGEWPAADPLRARLGRERGTGGGLRPMRSRHSAMPTSCSRRTSGPSWTTGRRGSATCLDHLVLGPATRGRVGRQAGRTRPMSACGSVRWANLSGASSTCGGRLRERRSSPLRKRSAELAEEQVKSIMLANVRQEFALKVIDPADRSRRSTK